MNIPIIEVKGLTKKYKNDTVLDKVSFGIRKGSICGLVGENGAGKTTLIKVLADLIFPDEGEVLYRGHSDKNSLRDLRKKCGFIVETSFLAPDLTAYENLNLQRLQRGIKKKEKIDEVLRIVGLEKTGKKKVAQFSLGMRQRLGIAIALLEEIEVLVLDEPINGLDPQGIVDFRNLVLKLNEEYGITILISSHILTELSLIANEYIFIHKGKLIGQISSDELVELCKKKYAMNVSDNHRAIEILRQLFGQAVDIGTEENGTILFSGEFDIHLLSERLCKSQIYIYRLQESTISLEQYYFSLMQ